MSQQSELDRVMAKIADDYGKLNRKQQVFAVKELGRIRGEIAELLTDYEGDDGTVKKQRLTRLLRDLETIEASVRKNGVATLQQIIDESSAYTTQAISSALGVAVVDRVNADVVKYVINRFGDDGLVLSDRVWNVAGDLRDELSKTLRAGIIRGESVGSLVKRVRQVHDNETWKINRLVITEGNVAYRVATAYNAQRSEVVRGLRIHRGKADRPEHRCTQLELADKHGLGAGIYLPTDSEIFSPHVNCTSFITYELID